MIGILLGGAYGSQDRNRWTDEYRSPLHYAQVNWIDGIRRHCGRPNETSEFKCEVSVISDQEMEDKRLDAEAEAIDRGEREPDYPSLR